MRILAVSHNFNLEGAAISMFELMSALAVRGQLSPSVMSLDSGPLGERYRSRGIAVLPLPFEAREVRSAATIRQAISALAAVIREQQPKLVYANTLLGYPVILAAAEAGVRSLWNIRESQPLEFWRNYLGERLSMALAAFEVTDAVVFVAEATRKLWLDSVTMRRSSIVRNGLDLAEFAGKSSDISREALRARVGVSPDAVVFLSVGTLHERKGQIDLLEAVAQLPDTHGTPVALCVGDSGGDYSKTAHAFRDGLPSAIRGRVVILPKQVHIRDFYDAADIFVCCSRNESYPRVILEAMASGLPIVTTPVFGIAEQVEFGRSALRYEPGDTCSLRAHLQEMLTAPVFRQSLAAESKKRFEMIPNFSTMIEGYAAVIADITANTVAGKGRK